MGSQARKFIGNAIGKSQAWGLTPQVTPDAPTWNISLNGKTLSYKSNGTVADAVNGMQALWAASTFLEFLEVTASIPSTINLPDNPQGLGTNEIQALYLSGSPTAGSFQINWGGVTTPFLVDPQAAPAAADSGSAGNPNGAYKYTITFLNVNPLGQTGETKPSGEVSVTVTSHSINVTVPAGPNGTIARRIYRTAAGGATGTEKLVATIWDNSTTTFLDNVADGSLGAAQPTANNTGIPYNATGAQLQNVLQTMSSIAQNNAVVSGSGTAAAPWLVQFANTLGSIKQPLIVAGSASFNYTPTVPATAAPTLLVSELQQGLEPNTAPATDGSVLLLISKAGVPFYLTSTVTGKIPPGVGVFNITPAQPTQSESITIGAQPPTIQVARTTAGKPGQNEVQRLTITPNAESGSAFTITFGGHTTNAIPTPPKAPSVSVGAGSLTGNYYYVITFVTATGETEHSAPSAQFNIPGAGANVTLPLGPSVVTARRIYRTLAGGDVNGPYYLVATQADNTTTTYTDSASDATIQLNPQAPTTNGVLLGEVEALASVGLGNVQVSGANVASYVGMTLQQGFSASPPPLSTAASTTAAATTLGATSGTGGSLPAGTYYYAVTSLDAQGETGGVNAPSHPAPEVSISVTGIANSVALSWSLSTTAKGYRIYRGTSAGNENTLVGEVGATAKSFIDYGNSPAPLIYYLEFIGSLANASQSSVTASFVNITVLPTITLVETQAGYPVQNERQVVGWKQQYGLLPPTGTFTLTFPSLNATTAPLSPTASIDLVANAIKAALPSQYANSVSVIQLVQPGTNGVYVEGSWLISFNNALALTPIPQTQLNLAGLAPDAPGDMLSAVEHRVQIGSATGRNEIITATINNAPTGGTFGLTGYLEDGNTISASSVAYNASAATLQAAFPAATANVSGSAGGPYTIEAIGQAGAQKVVWTATSSLTGASSASGSPPTSNTTALSAPASLSASQGVGGADLSAASYFYKVTATNSSGETTASPEASATISAIGEPIDLSWPAVSGATGYNVYRGTSAGAENLLFLSFANSLGSSCLDFGGMHTSASPPAVAGSSFVYPPTGVSASLFGSPSNFVTGTTYYYKVTAYDSTGESLPSAEASCAASTGQAIEIRWSGVNSPPFAKGYRIYRGTSPGGENVMIADLPEQFSNNFFVDILPATTIAGPPSSNTTALLAPVQSNTTPSASGGSLATNTYYYEITALNSMGETTASNEKTAAVTGPTGSVALSWAAVTGATGYKIYRGTSAGAENVLAEIITSGATTTFTDLGGVAALFSITELFLGNAASNEVQTITVTGAAGGTFTVAQDGQLTENVAYNASAAALQSALQSLTTVGANNCSVSLSTSNGQAAYTVTFNGDRAAGPQDLLVANGLNLQGGSIYTVSLTNATDNFTLSFGGHTTSPIAPTATAATVQSDLLALASIGGSNATVLGSSGGPWFVSLAASAVGSNVLTGTIISQTSSGAADVIYMVSVLEASGGSFSLTYGTAVSIAYNATAGQVQSALETTQIGSGNVTVTGSQGGPWTVTITPTAQNSGIQLLGAIGSLVGSKTSVDVYPLVYAMAVGPNFFDAAANWDGGTLPATYLAPPTLSSVEPISTDATLAAGTHGSLTSGTTYYYKVTATNANGETNGSSEGSAEAFAGAKFYFNGTATAGTYSLTYGGATASGIAYNATAATIQGDLQALGPIGSGNCTVTGSGTAADPFIFQLAGTLAGHTPTPLSANSSGLTGATISTYNLDTRSLLVSWNELPTATGYKVYRGTSAGSENVLVAAITSPDQTVFIDDGTYTTASASPPNGANGYNTAVGDDIYFTNSTVSCLYNVGAAIANGYSTHGGYNGSNYWAFNSFTADSSFTGRVGLPAASSSGYQEYRPLALAINGPPGSSMAVEVGGGSGQGSSFINLDTGTSQVSVSVSGAAPSTGTTPAVLWIGTNSASDVNLYRGSMGIGYYPGQTYQVGTVRQSYVDSQASDTTLIMGEGGTGITLFVQSGGDCQLSTSVATITGKGGTLTQDNGGVTTLLNLSGTVYTSRSTGAIVALKVSGSGEFDRSQDSRVLDLGSVSLYAGATYLDPHGCTVTTGQSYLAYSLVECGYEDVTLEIGKNVSAQRTQN